MKANNAVAISPEVHRILYENDRVRVLDVKLPVDKSTPMHWHPENVSYVLKGGKMRVLKPGMPVAEITLTEGQVLGGVEGDHTVENCGNSDIHTIQVELKR